MCVPRFSSRREWSPHTGCGGGSHMRRGLGQTESIHSALSCCPSKLALNVEIYSRVTSQNTHSCSFRTHEVEARAQELDSSTASTTIFRL